MERRIIEEFENFLERRKYRNIKESITRVCYEADYLSNVPLKVMVSSNLMEKVVSCL